jgi:CelD/BcsL family acetyltransferase involved in cellulose biosynthesis
MTAFERQEEARPDPPRDPAIRARILEEPAAISALVPDWTLLAEESRPAALFRHPAVWQTWAETVGRGRRNPVLALHEGDHLVGVLPLMMRHTWRGPTLGIRYDYDPADRRWLTRRSLRFVPVRQLSPVLSLPATMLGPMLLAAPGIRAAVIRASANAFAQLSKWDMLVLPIDAGDRRVWEEALATAGFTPVLQTLNRPACRLTEVAPMTSIVARQGKKFRQNVRRLEAAAEREGVTVSLSHDANASIPMLRQLAAQSWKARGRAGEHAIVPYDGAQSAFFEALIQRKDSPPLVTTIARRDQRPIAILIAAVHARTLTTLLTFWNGEAKDASPGYMVLAAAINWAAEKEIHTVDFNSNSPRLRHLSDSTSLHHNLLAFAPSARGKALNAIRRGALIGRDLWRQRRAGNLPLEKAE